MKVKMRNYRTFHTTSSVFYNYMQKKYGNGWNYGEATTLFEKLLEKLEKMLDFVYNNTTNKIPEGLLGKRVKVRIDPWDTFDMQENLAHIILPMLKQLKKTHHGAPKVDLKDVPEELLPPEGFTQENPWEPDENYYKRWEWVLDEMIYAFDAVLKEDDNSFTSELYQNDTLMELHYKRQKRGFELFGKYYQALWD
jgi:hypothetical protein